MLIFQFLVPVLTPDAVPGDEGPSLLELDLFSLMVSNVPYQPEHCPFTITEALLPPPELTHGLSFRGSLLFEVLGGGGREMFCYVIVLCIDFLLHCVLHGRSKNFII